MRKLALKLLHYPCWIKHTQSTANNRPDKDRPRENTSQATSIFACTIYKLNNLRVLILQIKSKR